MDDLVLGTRPPAIGGRSALRRRLDHGPFRQFVEEIEIFQRGALGFYCAILGIKPKHLWHNYTLILEAGANAGGSLGVDAAVEAASLRITYHNALDMSWEERVPVLNANVGVSFGMPTGGTLNVATHQGVVGTARSLSYYGPDHFDGALVSGVDAGASALLDVGMGTTTFTKDGRSLTFESGVGLGTPVSVEDDRVGLAVGTDLAPGEGIQAKLGRAFGQNRAKLHMAPVVDVKPPVLPDTFIVAHIYFETGKTALDDDDIAAVHKVVMQMIDHHQEHPDHRFKIDVLGSASQLGPEDLNQLLRNDRAHHVRAFLEREILSTGVWSRDKLAKVPVMERTRYASTLEPQDNRQSDRVVMLAVQLIPAGN